MVMVFGEITTKAKVDYEKVVRQTCKEIGFDGPEKGLDYKTCKVMVQLDETVTNDKIAADIHEHVIKPVVPAKYLD